MIAVPIAAAFWGATSTAAVSLTVHVLAALSGKNLRPHLTSVSVSLTTCMIAGATWAHFELAPHPVAAPAPPSGRHIWLLTSSFIEPERSRRMRMSGATFIAVLLRAPQLASGFGLTGPSLVLASTKMIGVEPP